MSICVACWVVALGGERTRSAGHVRAFWNDLGTRNDLRIVRTKEGAIVVPGLAGTPPPIISQAHPTQDT